MDSERLSDALTALQLKSKGRETSSLKAEGQASGGMLAVPTAEEQATQATDDSTSRQLAGTETGESGPSEPRREPLDQGEVAGAKTPPMDPALKDALGSGRDRSFVLKIEAEMVSFLQDES